MMRRRRAPRDNAGIALLTAMIFISVSVLVITAVTARHLQQRLLVDQYQIYQTAFDAVEAAHMQSKALLDSGNSGIIGLQGWTPVYDANNNLVLPPFDSRDANPATLASLPGAEFMSYVVNWGGDGRDSNGDGVVDSALEQGMFSIHSVARFRGVERRVESVYRSSNVNAWQNAIFAGNGQAGGLINGNVSIYGSVHLLGNNIMLGNPAITSMDLSGTSLIHNNYEGMPAHLRSRIPNPPTRLVGGRQVETLNATLRVRRGLVGMSGNSEIGEPDNPSNNHKELMDGVFVNDGWTGNSVINDGGRGIPRNVFSDNSHTSLYDLGSTVNMPMLSDPWRDKNGNRVMNPATGTWYTHEDYFSQVLLADPNSPNDGIHTGNLTLDANSSTAIFWNAHTGQKLTGNDALNAVLNPDHDYLWFNPVTNVLRINGQIRINGSLVFTGQGNQDTIHYSGRGAILATGDVTIDTNLLTCNNGNPASTALSFPENNCLGIMTKANMMVGGSSQLDIMGAFYAQGTITTQRQTRVMGTFVANYFNMGSNVPRIFQVPVLGGLIPLGMVGDYPIGVVSRVSWRELGS